MAEDYIEHELKESETVSEETPMPDSPPSNLGQVNVDLGQFFESLKNRIENEVEDGPQKVMALRKLSSARGACLG